MYFISLFSPGRRYADIVSKQLDFDAASNCVANIILGQVEGRPDSQDRHLAEREGDVLCVRAPSKATLDDGATLFIDKMPRRSC